MRITREYLRERQACYLDDDATDEQREALELLPPDGCTPIELCDCAAVPVLDRLWVLLHSSVIPEPELRQLACRWAAGALNLARVDDVRSWRAVWTSWQYSHGLATDEQLAAAREAARDAEWDAARAAEWGAAWAAAWAAAEDAAWAAAEDAAWGAAWGAAREAAREAARAGSRNAARNAARAGQLRDVLKVLIKIEERTGE